MKQIGFISWLAILLLVLPLLAACSSASSTSSSQAPATSKTAVAPTSSTTAAAPAATTSAAAVPAAQPTETKTLKVGIVCWFGWPFGIDMKQGIETLVDVDNNNGGLDIGGEKYKIQLISYDSNNSQTTEVAAINRLVFEDKVQVILADGMYENAWYSITEANKVLALSAAGQDSMFGPNSHYCFNAALNHTQTSIAAGWYVNNYPDKAKNFINALPDNQLGHMIAGRQDAIFGAFGVTNMTDIFYPASAQDLSSIGTKIATLNPGTFSAIGGGDLGDALVYKAVWLAGYRGQFFVGDSIVTSTLAKTVPIEGIEGFISTATPTESDPALTQVAQDFKTAWIAKYGKWENPNISFTTLYCALKAAMLQAGSVDMDKTTDVLASGLKFESPMGAIQMISRPDLKNDRTVDSIAEEYIKQVQGGKPVILTTIKIEEGLNYFRTANANMSAPPSGAP